MAELRVMWRHHLERQDEEETRTPVRLLSSFLPPSGGRQDEELITVKMAQVEMEAIMKETALRCRELEMEAEAATGQIERLQTEVEAGRRSGREEKAKLREGERKLEELEGRLKDTTLMGRIKEAEHSQEVARLQQRIAELELKETEAAARDQIQVWGSDLAEEQMQLDDRLSAHTLADSD